ncbi:MAG: hypothetical protein A2Y12_01560 [Planctomycetes bacterium GWF2_42_9]|nr:MAG: hypothetical protein A2Y12_01560 [Planctomycetes bacterium GWF2_42_9]
MGIKVHDENTLTIMKITGLLKKADLDAIQTTAAKDLVADQKLKLNVLVIVEDFKGWQEGADWSDMSFYFEHGERIAKIALVADPKRQQELLMFMGSGIRPTPLKAFKPDQVEDAKKWLLGNQ